MNVSEINYMYINELKLTFDILIHQRLHDNTITFCLVHFPLQLSLKNKAHDNSLNIKNTNVLIMKYETFTMADDKHISCHRNTSS